MADLTALERITFRCKYPDNCNCCGPNRKAFVAVRTDAERMQREHQEDLQRMERATVELERQSRIIRRMAEWLEKNQPDVFQRGMWEAINEQ